jgi:hypothetical protein
MSFKDNFSSTDHVDAGLSTEEVVPEHPCPICGRAMKDNNTDEEREAGKNMRICSSGTCRAKADWTSGVGVLLNN